MSISSGPENTTVGSFVLASPTPQLTIFFYTIIDSPGRLYFDYPTSTFLVSESNTPHTAGDVVTGFWWNLPGSALGLWSSTGGGSSTSTEIKLTASLVSIAPASTGSETRGSSVSPVTSTPAIYVASTGTPQQTTVPQNIRSGLSGGAVAGVAIGCLVAGALIAGLVLQLCCGKRRGRHARGSEVGAIALIPPEKGALSNTHSLHAGNPLQSGANTVLPQPLEDQAIAGEVSKIGSLIKNHVQSYYHNKPVTPGLMDHDDLAALGRSLPISAGTLNTLLDNTGTREIALRFCIAWAIVKRLQNYGNPSESFLPPEMCAPMREISSMDNGNKAHTLKVAYWRIMTTELMRSTYVQTPFSTSDSRNVAILSLAQALGNVLQPFVNSGMDDQERGRNLEEILKRSALFAFTMFSQPSTWDFDWKETQSIKAGELCIFPALVQVTDEAGERVKSPRSFSEAVIRRLEG